MLQRGCRRILEYLVFCNFISKSEGRNDADVVFEELFIRIPWNC